VRGAVERRAATGRLQAGKKMVKNGPGPKELFLNVSAHDTMTAGVAIGAIRRLNAGTRQGRVMVLCLL